MQSVFKEEIKLYIEPHSKVYIIKQPRAEASQ